MITLAAPTCFGVWVLGFGCGLLLAFVLAVLAVLAADRRA